MSGILIALALIVFGVVVSIADSARRERPCVNCGHIGHAHETYEYIPAPCLRSGCSCKAYLPSFGGSDRVANE